MDTKKDVGVKFLSAPIPDFRLSHCPYIKDKQLQACPRQMILLPNTTAHLPHVCHIRKDSTPMNGVHLIIYI